MSVLASSPHRVAAAALAAAVTLACAHPEPELPQAQKAISWQDGEYCGGLEVDDLGMFWSRNSRVAVLRGVNVWYWEDWRRNATLLSHTEAGSVTLMDDDADYLYMCSPGGAVARARKWEEPDNLGPENVGREVLTEDDCFEIVVNGGYAYWAYYAHPDPLNPELATARRVVARYDTTTGDLVTLVDLGTEGLSRLVFDPRGEKLYATAGCGVSELPTVPGGEPRCVSSFDGWPADYSHLGSKLAVDDAYVYWTALRYDSVQAWEDRGAVFRAPLDGSQAWEVFADDQYYPAEVRYHAGYVYWFVGRDSHSGRLMRKASDAEAGAKPEVVAAGFSDGVELEFWNGYAFWADFGTGWFYKKRVEPEAGQ